MIEESILRNFYEKRSRSMQEIAKELNCSLHKVAYWLKKYDIPIRSRSEAMYIKHNPKGDPFLFRNPETLSEATLFGLGIGLYWGEGTKANKNSIRLGNTEPGIIKKFMNFLIFFFNIEREDFTFGLQIFSDINTEEALDFWVEKLNIQRSQINKPVITRSGTLGTYRKKSQYGVMTIMYLIKSSVICSLICCRCSSAGRATPWFEKAHKKGNFLANPE